METLRARALAYRRSALYDGLTVTAKARQTYRDSFTTGHSCSLCGTVTLPVDLDELERLRRSQALRNMHFSNLAFAASKARRRKAEGDAE